MIIVIAIISSRVAAFACVGKPVKGRRRPEEEAEARRSGSASMAGTTTGTTTGRAAPRAEAPALPPPPALSRRPAGNARRGAWRSHGDDGADDDDVHDDGARRRYGDDGADDEDGDMICA